MVKIDSKIILTGIICLTAIYITLAILNKETQVIGAMIVSVIALCVGVIIPTPTINKRGMLKW